MPFGTGGIRRQPMFGEDARDLRTQLVTMDTADRHTWDGMLYRPRYGDPARRRLAVLVVHGSVGNYVTGLPRRVSFGLASEGYTVLAVNTRMANYGVFFGGGLLHRTPLDLDAALEVLERHGYHRVVLLGYSMGATMVTHFQALRRPGQVVGVCTLAHPLSLPESLRRRWERFGASPTYEEVTARCRRMLMPDPDESPNDRIFIVQRASGPTDLPQHAEIWTYRTWWSSRGPEAEHAESRSRIGHVTVPMALIQAGDDQMVPLEEGPELSRIARAGECPSVRLATIGGADHVFRRRENWAIATAAQWLERFT
jgi:dienelactone hydrolase